jgi:nitrogen-specific signal transduction histidine kinase/CheY-like chemotaxis protein
MEYCVSIRRDVTARRQAEVALRLAGVGTLAAGAAHEINNPLAFIGSNMAFLRETLERLQGELPAGEGGAGQVLEEALQAARESEEGARRIREIVSGLAAFTRRGDDRLEAVDVRRAVAAAIGLTRNEIRHRARLVEKIADEVPAVIASQHRIEQVVVNLLVNAAQAIPEGAAETNTIAVTVSRTDTGEAAIEVCDTGCGMPPDVRVRIFEPFFTTKPVGAGTGLGLYVCHGIVSELGGHIEVESEPGKGSTFRVVLPGSAPAAVRPPPEPPAEPVAGRVLVVDDDPSVGASIRRLLSPGQEVTLSTDAREALGRLGRGETFDLVICDLMMPGISGMEFHQTLTRMAPQLARDMIFMTGGAFTPRAQAFLTESSHAWIAKPFAPEALRSLVSEKLAARHRR